MANFAFSEDETVLAQGSQLYPKNCSHCHNQIARSTGGAIPDLGVINEGIYRNFEDIVLKGVLSPNGIPNFKGKLTTEEVLSIKSYVLSQAKEKLEDLSASKDLQ